MTQFQIGGSYCHVSFFVYDCTSAPKWCKDCGVEIIQSFHNTVNKIHLSGIQHYSILSRLLRSITLSTLLVWVITFEINPFVVLEIIRSVAILKTMNGNSSTNNYVNVIPKSKLSTLTDNIFLTVLHSTEVNSPAPIKETDLGMPPDTTRGMAARTPTASVISRPAANLAASPVPESTPTLKPTHHLQRRTTKTTRILRITNEFNPVSVDDE